MKLAGRSPSKGKKTVSCMLQMKTGQILALEESEGSGQVRSGPGLVALHHIDHEIQKLWSGGSQTCH